MKLGVIATALLVMSGAAFAAEATQLTTMRPAGIFVRPPSCATGFTYSVKEQFGDPATGHLWYICRADFMCRGKLLAGTANTGTPNTFRFTYSCEGPASMAFQCPAGFTDTSVPAAPHACITPILSCPPKFMMMGYTATTSADYHAGQYQYQCYRPG